jgi:hypothetical protein
MMKSFDQYMKDSFEDRMETHLRQLYPEQIDNLSKGQLQGLIEDGIQCAEGYGMSLEEDIARFLELYVVLGHRFDEEPEYTWAKAILGDTQHPAANRLDLIFERIQFGDA